MIDTNQLARIALIALLVAGGLLVLQPFMAALMFAAVICVSTWPFYSAIRHRFGGRNTLAAGVMTILLLLALIVPMAYLAANLADSATALFQHLRPRLEHPQPFVPSWVRNMPLIGESIADFWLRITSSHDEFMLWISQYQGAAREWALRMAGVLGQGLFQLVLVVVTAFFFYRDGETLGRYVARMAEKLGDEFGLGMLALSTGTVKAVMLGIFGTAVAQAVVAWIGFTVVGAPAPLLLASATFFLSMVPVGPPLIWGGVALWLLDQGSVGWAIFMALYGLLAISTVDNVVKPILISQSAKLPLLLILLGVLGGAIAFGLIGIFLGPTLLALGLKLTQHWMDMRYSS
jgi:predicted PurR-regulated permease PerM